ncbi:DoxX family membrane protein [Flavobacteriaceae bacterium AU392]|nr:DoxX family protein [Flavobacteriaceae bacterium]RKM86032.1 DoxX family membrane protein [Flavobacteriaceae bacterium AU392]
MKNNKTDLALAILRIGASALLLTHGIPKISGLSADPIQFADPIGLGATITLILAIIGEVVGPALIIIGYKTKLATIPVILTMAVAAFVYHASDPIGTKEKALLYLIIFITIFFAGPGKYSIDKK